MADPTIEQTIEVQKRLGETEHVCFAGESGFVLAHTDAERSAGTNTEEGCALHQWLRDLDGPPAPPGAFYRVTLGESGSYRFVRLGDLSLVQS